ncbi:SRPBCC family protein [Streptomyces fuscichromogenes]|uniref:Carbon monoxide dehydrogenase subunit G n=1 Tax=Streptomyces fuscichromogenes TaxID=1324013 RepID=A0A917XFK1_9ACTN|nr:SRPBCC family protein [Streptomyces fuscichromogenes]GGN20285.1 hypothetical protein GCM10011578_050760 [Streptomyces fuscichromogenes]
MQLANTFTVAAPLDAVWEAFKAPERVAPSFPGATLTEHTDDSFAGTVKIKVGPITMSYQGKGSYIERDDVNHIVIIDASGRDARGSGTASVIVTATLKDTGPDKTEVSLATDLNITGRAAQFGRGVIAEVADRMIGQFADRLATSLADPATATGPSLNSVPTGGASRPVGAAASQDEAINLLGVAGGPVAKMLVPVAALVLAAVAAIAALRGRRRR